MNKHDLDHARIVEAWLKEPTVLPPSDTARLTQLVHQTTQQRHWWQRLFSPGRNHTMFSAFKLAAASIILAATGGFLFSTVLSPQDGPQLPPAAGTTAPDAATPVPATEAPTMQAVESAAPAPDATDVAEPDVAPVDVTAADAVLVLDAGSGETVGGYTQVGRLATQDRPGVTEMFDLQSLGGLLVARSALTTPDEQKDGVILYSDDAMAWAAAELPGEQVEVEDLVRTDDGLLAAGSAVSGGQQGARLWSSRDGVAWSEVASPPVRRIQQIVLADGRDTLVRAGNQLWIDDGRDGAWRVWNKVEDATFLAGPGGILSYRGGGQDLQVPTTVLHWATPRSAISEVVLPDALAWGEISVDDVPAHMGIQIFALDDQWVMVGSEHKAPDQIHVSSNGRDWVDVPRPPEMAEGAVRWIADVGGEVQGLGIISREDTNPTGLWSFTPGEPVDAADTFGTSGDVWFDAPVAWDGGYVANGWDRGREQALTLWMRD